MRGRFSEVDARQAIREKIMALARQRGIETGTLSDAEVLPESGVLDSAGVLDLIMWFEMTFDVSIEQADLTLENFGTINAMVKYLQGP